jgi:hypothetical protein
MSKMVLSINRGSNLNWLVLTGQSYLNDLNGLIIYDDLRGTPNVRKTSKIGALFGCPMAWRHTMSWLIDRCAAALHGHGKK